MTGAEPVDEIDWDEVERRGRARQPLSMLGVVAAAAGWAGASKQVFFATGTAKWVVAAAYAVLIAGLTAMQRLHPRLRVRTDEAYRALYALREHVDPGPPVRDTVDRQAAYMARIVWFRWWLLLLIPAGLSVNAPWGDDSLIVVPSVLVVFAAVLAWALFMRRIYAAARRWVADPPGPSREMPQLRRWQRWASGWAFVWTLLGILVAVTGLGVLLVVLR